MRQVTRLQLNFECMYTYIYRRGPPTGAFVIQERGCDKQDRVTRSAFVSLKVDKI